MRHYSFETKGFYLISGVPLPSDAVEVSDEQYVELLNGLNSGKVIRNDGGTPVLADPDPLHSPSVVPVSVTMMQARLAMLNAQILDKVEAAIAAVPGDAGQSARIQWEFAMDVRRDWPLVAVLQQAVGFTDEQTDTLFIAAAAI